MILFLSTRCVLSVFSVLWDSPLRWLLGHLFDLYPLERTSASYQRDLNPIVLEKRWDFGINCTIISDL